MINKLKKFKDECKMNHEKLESLIRKKQNFDQKNGRKKQKFERRTQSA